MIKNISRKLLVIIMVLIITMNISVARTIQEVADDMQVSVSDAKKILKATYSLIKEIQNNFTSIGSNSYDYEQKIGENGLINSTISNYFSSKNATVEVSSINHNKIIQHTIYNYLHRLANMSKNNTYQTIKLEFGKKLFFKDIYKDDNKINISVDAFQLFEGCKNSHEGRSCYSDITKKTFVVKVANNGLSYNSYVSSINVKETMRVNGNTHVILE